MTSSQRKMKSGISERVKSVMFCSKRRMEMQKRAEVTAEERAKLHRKNSQGEEAWHEGLKKTEKDNSLQLKADQFKEKRKAERKKKGKSAKTDLAKYAAEFDEVKSESDEERENANRWFDEPNKSDEMPPAKQRVREDDIDDYEKVDEGSDDEEMKALQNLDNENKRAESLKSKTNSGGRVSRDSKKERLKIIKAPKSPVPAVQRALEDDKDYSGDSDDDSDDEREDVRPSTVSADTDMAELRELVNMSGP